MKLLNICPSFPTPNHSLPLYTSLPTLIITKDSLTNNLYHSLSREQTLFDVITSLISPAQISIPSKWISHLCWRDEVAKLMKQLLWGNFHAAPPLFSQLAVVQKDLLLKFLVQRHYQWFISFNVIFLLEHRRREKTKRKLFA